MINPEAATPTPISVDEGEAGLPRLVIWGVIIVVLAILFLGFSVWLWSRDEPPAVPVVEGREDPAALRREVEAHAEERLTSYGWTDRERDLVHIPLERAMDLWLEEQGADAEDGGDE